MRCLNPSLSNNARHASSGTCVISASVAGLKTEILRTFLIARDEFTVDKILAAFHVDLPCYILQMECDRDKSSKR